MSNVFIWIYECLGNWMECWNEDKAGDQKKKFAVCTRGQRHCFLKATLAEFDSLTFSLFLYHLP
jgi:hypothetical protein